MSKLLKNNGELIDRIAYCMAHRNDHQFMRFCKHLDSGYTYIGQLVSHELTPITDPHRASRQVSGLMDLDSIYGNLQNYQLQHITNDDLFFDCNGYFKFSMKAKLDFQRNPAGIAIIPERRNDDHVLIGQMHLFWQRLHNALLKNGLAKDASDAKKLVVLTFQMMIIEDYLHRIVDTSVYQAVICDNNDFMDKADIPCQDIFRFAAFRFGHSMIRNTYTLRLVKDDPLSSRALIDLFIGNRNPRCMSDDDYVDWRALFCLQGRDRFEGVMPIDTRISSFMTKIPDENGQDIAIHIARRNLISELDAQLPSGLEVAKTIESVLPASIKKHFCLLDNNAIEDATFSRLSLDVEDLTNWMYILLESQLVVDPHRLGIVASCINTHVIKQAIKQANLSVYHKGHYHFDDVVNKLGTWGQILKSFAIANEANQGGAITMANLVNYLTEHE